MIIASLVTADRVRTDVGRVMVRLHAPESLELMQPSGHRSPLGTSRSSPQVVPLGDG
jgi:hypothetical protein